MREDDNLRMIGQETNLEKAITEDEGQGLMTAPKMLKVRFWYIRYNRNGALCSQSFKESQGQRSWRSISEIWLNTKLHSSNRSNHQVRIQLQLSSPVLCNNLPSFFQAILLQFNHQYSQHSSNNLQIIDQPFLIVNHANLPLSLTTNLRMQTKQSRICIDLPLKDGKSSLMILTLYYREITVEKSKRKKPREATPGRYLGRPKRYP